MRASAPEGLFVFNVENISESSPSYAVQWFVIHRQLPMRY